MKNNNNKHVLCTHSHLLCMVWCYRDLDVISRKNRVDWLKKIVNCKTSIVKYPRKPNKFSFFFFILVLSVFRKNVLTKNCIPLTTLLQKQIEILWMCCCLYTYLFFVLPVKQWNIVVHNIHRCSIFYCFKHYDEQRPPYTQSFTITLYLWCLCVVADLADCKIYSFMCGEYEKKKIWQKHKYKFCENAASKMNEIWCQRNLNVHTVHTMVARLWNCELDKRRYGTDLYS